MKDILSIIHYSTSVQEIQFKFGLIANCFDKLYKINGQAVITLKNKGLLEYSDGRIQLSENGVTYLYGS